VGGVNPKELRAIADARRKRLVKVTGGNDSTYWNQERRPARYWADLNGLVMLMARRCVPSNL
jgi:hypothetical protein